MGVEQDSKSREEALDNYTIPGLFSRWLGYAQCTLGMKCLPPVGTVYYLSGTRFDTYSAGGKPFAWYKKGVYPSVAFERLLGSSECVAAEDFVDYMHPPEHLELNEVRTVAFCPRCLSVVDTGSFQFLKYKDNVEIRAKKRHEILSSRKVDCAKMWLDAVRTGEDPFAFYMETEEISEKGEKAKEST